MVILEAEEEDAKMRVIRLAQGMITAAVSVMPKYLFQEKCSSMRQRRAIPVIGTVLITRNAKVQEVVEEVEVVVEEVVVVVPPLRFSIRSQPRRSLSRPLLRPHC